MKGVVVYYSAAGNTRKITRAIHRGMKDSMEECGTITVVFQIAFRGQNTTPDMECFNAGEHG